MSDKDQLETVPADSESPEPSPEFVERLEWQVRREVRRQERFAPRTVPVWRRGWLRTAALVVVSVLAGYAGATAAQDASSRRQLELLELQSESELEMARLQLEFASERLGEIERRAAVGGAGEDELGRARFERAFLERQVAEAQLDMEELQETGRPPRNDLGAPRVNGRDLVGERIRLRFENLRDQCTHLAFEIERFESGVAVGTVDPYEVQYRRWNLAEIERSIQLVRRVLELREAVLAGELTADDAEAERELLEARRKAESAEAQVEMARASAARTTRAPEAGALELRQAEYQLRIAEIQAEIAQLRLRALRQARSERE